MICKIVYFSEAEFPETAVIQIQDELINGEQLYISQHHSMTIEHVVESGDMITILDGEKIIKLKEVN